MGSKIIDEAVLKGFGYETTRCESVEQTKWEKEQYGSAVVDFQQIKMRQLEDGRHPRYTIHRETFKHSKQAINRLSKIRECDPSNPNDMDKAAVWNTGFVDGTSVIYVSTDADVFGYNAIKALKEKIEEHYNK